MPFSPTIALVVSVAQRTAHAAGSYIRETSAYQRVAPFVEPVFDRVSSWVSNARHRYQQWRKKHPFLAAIVITTLSVLLFAARFFFVTHPAGLVILTILSWLVILL